MTPTLRAFPRRRGSVYILVLMSAAMLTVVGIGVATITRTQIRTDGLDRDVERASRMAISAAHAGIAWMNSTPDWRTRHATAIVNGEVPDFGHFKLTQEAGGAECKWWFDDGSGGPVSQDASTRVRVIGLGRSGRAQRIITATLEPDTSAAVEVFRFAAYSGYKLTVAGADTFDGPLGSSADVAISGTVAGSVEAPAKSGTGTLKGTALVPSPALPLPAPSGTGSPFNTLAASARTIAYASIVGGRLQNRVISPGVNPLGTAQADGIYRVDVPAGQTLEIRDCRIKGTFLIQLGANSRLRLTNAVHWQPAADDLPALVVSGSTGSVEFLSSSSNLLSESSTATNFNPASTPYAGASDSDTNDSYSSQIAGLIHVGGGASVTVASGMRIFGAVIADGAIDIAAATLRADPSLRSKPLRGYTNAGSRVRIVEGSWTQPPFAQFALAEPASDADKSIVKADDGDDEVIKK